MVLHIVIFLATAVLAGWLYAKGALSGDGRRKRGFCLFLLTALSGNLLGLTMTMQEMQDQSGCSLLIEKQEDIFRQEAWIVSVDGEEEELVLRIPPKEKTADTEAVFPEEQAEEQRQTLEEMTEAWNRTLSDPEHFHLPAAWEGKPLTWRRKPEHTGAFLGMLFWGTGILLYLAAVREKDRLREKREAVLQAEYPALIMRFTLFLEAGLSVRSAFQRLAADYEAQEMRAGSAVCPEILTLCREIESGVSETEAYRHFGERCGQIRYRTLSALLAQNLRRGTRYLTDVLEREAMDAWEEQKRRARVQGEITSVRLLIPMLLMLLEVLALIMIPAFLSFYKSGRG